MRIPLELLRCVLEHAAETLTLQEWLTIRMVDRTFNQEALEMIFKLRLFDRKGAASPLFTPEGWATFPALLKRYYLAGKVKQHFESPCLYACLVHRIIQSQEHAGVEREQSALSMQELLEISVNDPAHLSVLFTPNFHCHEVQYACTPTPQARPRKDSVVDFDGLPATREFESSYKVDLGMVRVAQAVERLDPAAIKKLFGTESVYLDDESICFGIRPLQFAVQNGNADMLDAVLRWGSWSSRSCSGDMPTIVQRIRQALNTAIKRRNHHAFRTLLEHPSTAGHPKYRSAIDYSEPVLLELERAIVCNDVEAAHFIALNCPGDIGRLQYESYLMGVEFCGPRIMAYLTEAENVDAQLSEGSLDAVTRDAASNASLTYTLAC